MIIEPKTQTSEDPSIVYDDYTELLLSTTDYILLVTPGREYVIQNRSGNPVYLAYNDDPSLLTGSDNQMAIGGTVYEYNTQFTKFTWIRASVPDTVVSIRPADMTDPNGDISNLTSLVNTLSLEFKNHRSDKDNIDHEVTKALVGLGNIPNAISDEIASNNSEILATTKLTNAVYAILDAHKKSTGNVHDLNKSDIDLGNVSNYVVANSDNPDDLLITVDNKYVTPKGVYYIAQVVSTVSRSAKPQLVLEAPVAERQEGWFLGECDAPPAHTVILGKNIIVKAGLRVSFGYDYKSAISDKLGIDIPIALPENDGTSYVYVDINSSSQICSAGITTKAPIYGTHLETSSGADFYNYVINQMYNSEGAPIRRVYISKVIISSGLVTSLVQVPIGVKYTMPLDYQLTKSARFIIDNPFMNEYVKTTAEVAYQNNFGPTGWNDQIGVIANLHPANPDRAIVVQCGQVGFLCAGRESGNAFGSAFTTIYNNLRTRIVVERTTF